jgi:hypothetical protein
MSLLFSILAVKAWPVGIRCSKIKAIAQVKRNTEM